MSNLIGSESIMVGSGWSIPITNLTIPQPVPSREYLAVGPGRLTPKIPQALTHGFDDVSKTLGYRAYEAMLTDPAVQSCYLGLKLSILDGAMQLRPAVEPSPEVSARLRRAKARKALGAAGQPDDGTATGDDGERLSVGLSPDEQLSRDVLDFCKWAICRLPDFNLVLLQLLDAMAYGCKLAEMTYEPIEGGRYAGKLAWESAKVKPNWAWQFIVDSYLNVKGYLSYLAAIGQYIIVGPEKFCVHSWMPHNSDPRGTSVLRAAYAAWNLKIQSYPLYYQHLCRWGSPSVSMTMAEGDITPRPPVDQHGQPIPGAAPVDPVEYHSQQLAQFQNGSSLVHPFGSVVEVFEPKSPGDAFLNGFDLFDRQICMAIELQARATMEAKNGSKADSETAQDKRGPLVTWGRDSLANCVRFGMLRYLVELNFGKAVADEHLPEVSFGKVEHQDRASLWTAAADLRRSNYLGDSQLAALDAEIGLPVRDAEEDAAADQERQQQAAAIAGGATGPNGGDGAAQDNGEGKPAPGTGGARNADEGKGSGGFLKPVRDKANGTPGSAPKRQSKDDQEQDA